MILSRSSQGVAQVSNLELLLVRASVPSRPFPPPGVIQKAMQAEVTVYHLSPQGERNVVPSSVKPQGGGGDEKYEWTAFWLDIPIDETARTAAILRYVTDMGASADLERG